MRSVLACSVFVIVACSSTTPPRPTTAAERPRTDAAAVAPPPAADGPSAAECDALFTHALGITFAAMQPPPSDADQRALRGELRAGFVADCRAGTRAYHRCGLAAKSVADLSACR